MGFPLPICGRRHLPSTPNETNANSSRMRSSKFLAVAKSKPPYCSAIAQRSVSNPRYAHTAEIVVTEASERLILLCDVRFEWKCLRYTLCVHYTTNCLPQLLRNGVVRYCGERSPSTATNSLPQLQPPGTAGNLPTDPRPLSTRGCI